MDDLNEPEALGGHERRTPAALTGPPGLNPHKKPNPALPTLEAIRRHQGCRASAQAVKTAWTEPTPVSVAV